MADYFTRFSCLLPLETHENAERALTIMDDMVDNWEPEEGEHQAPPLGFEASIDDGQPATLWIRDGDGDGEPGHVAAFVVRCAEELDLDGRWGFQWTLTCNKPKLDAYGGGALIIDLGQRVVIDRIATGDWLSKRVNEKDEVAAPEHSKDHNTPQAAPASTGHDGRAFVLFPHGTMLDLLDPDPASWRDEDLAKGLSRTYRWNGHSKYPRPLSVAQHSLTVLRLLMRDDLATPQLRLHALLHDGEEGLLGFDCITPLKPILGAPFAAVTRRLTAAIAKRYALPELSSAERKALKAADREAAAIEAVHVVGWPPSQVRDILGLDAPSYDPLEPIALWSTPQDDEKAERAWLDLLHEELRLRENRNAADAAN